jgi:TetR/AcrR family transcriptional repressor of mexJK operon
VATTPKTRSSQRRGEILAAGRKIFVSQGYLGASMDAVAAAAGMSKRTVYQYFADKESLFAAAVLDTVDQGYEFFAPRIRALAEAEDIAEALRANSRITLAGVMQPEILQMRRLVIAEAERFPDVGRAYYERSWGRTLALLAETLQRLHDQGVLHVPHPERSAHFYTWLVISIPANRVAFLGDAETYTPIELDELADEATRVFLAAHQPNQQRSRLRPRSK